MRNVTPNASLASANALSQINRCKQEMPQQIQAQLAAFALSQAKYCE